MSFDVWSSEEALHRWGAVNAGQPVKMGKRAGNIITVDEVMHEIDDRAGRKGAERAWRG